MASAAYNKKLSEQANARYEKIVELRRRGLKHREIATELGVSMPTVSLACRRKGVHTGDGRQSLRKVGAPEVLRLRKTGMELREIASVVGLSYGSVQRICIAESLGGRVRPEVRIDGDIAYIPLANGRGEAIIDASDAPSVQLRSWHLKGGSSGHVYVYSGGKKNRAILHRLIMRAPSHMQVDHINHNTLDNRRSNLRLVTPRENAWNARRVKNTGLPRNVRRARGGGFYANGNITTDIFSTPEEAAAEFKAMLERAYRTEVNRTEKCREFI